MRFRHTLAAVACALAVTFVLPSPAQAAQGEFLYTYVGMDGRPQIAALTDPPSGECFTLPEVADPHASEPAHSPLNFTTSTAVVFTDPDCEGDYFSLRPLGGHGSSRLKLRSVVFS